MSEFKNINRSPKGILVRITWLAMHYIAFASVLTIIFLALAAFNIIPYTKDTVMMNSFIYASIVSAIFAIWIFILSLRQADYRVTSLNIEFFYKDKIKKTIPLASSVFTAQRTVVFSLLPNHCINVLIAQQGKHNKRYRIHLSLSDFDDFMDAINDATGSMSA